MALVLQTHLADLLLKTSYLGVSKGLPLSQKLVLRRRVNGKAKLFRVVQEGVVCYSLLVLNEGVQLAGDTKQETLVGSDAVLVFLGPCLEVEQLPLQHSYLSIVAHGRVHVIFVQDLDDLPVLHQLSYLGLECGLVVLHAAHSSPPLLDDLVDLLRARQRWREHPSLLVRVALCVQLTSLHPKSAPRSHRLSLSTLTDAGVSVDSRCWVILIGSYVLL